MAELQTIDHMPQVPICVAEPAPARPEVLPQPVGAGPLWRSLLFPHRGQRALEIGGDDSTLFAFLREAGVRIERRAEHPGPAAVADLDLVLEHRREGRTPVRPVRIRSFLAPGGRWVVALEGNGWIGLAGRRILRRAMREGFETIETYYAYPSLHSPRILVPLDRPEPFLYFLRLAVGVHAPRQRLLALGARCLCALRLHRMVLPNLIMVARRTK